jgi:CDP-glycerol glycerophosphotransferase (TagB/SpsB family)
MLVTNAPVGGAELTFYKFRDEEVRFSTSARPRKMRLVSRIRDLPARLASGMRRQLLTFVLAGVPWQTLRSSLYGITIKTTLGTCAVRCNFSGILHPTATESVYHYCDPSGKILRLELFHFSPSELQEILDFSPEDRADTLCLVGEYPNSARDNGIALHTVLQDRPISGLDLRYVIEADNPDKLAPNGHSIIEYGSKEHLCRCKEARVVAFTHHAHYVMPGITRHLAPTHHRNVRRLFLQHGITALKASMNAYSKKTTGYDAINVCSDLEKKIVAEACLFPPEQVRIAGFPRHDILLRKAAGAKPDRDQVLVFPTWRKGLEQLDSDAARETLFVRQWISLLGSLRAGGKTKVAFVLHPVLRRHAHLFEQHVDIVADAVNFQDTLTQSSCLITDYSSVCFEALYLGKPTFFFTFDAMAYGFAQQAYINVETQLPGERFDSPEELVEAVSAAHQLSWPTPSPEVVRRFFAHRDDRNSERCASLILELARHPLDGGR